MSTELRNTISRDSILKLVKYFINMKENEKAIPLLKKLVSDFSRDAEYCYYYAFCLHQSNLNTQTALFYYDRALKFGFDEFWVRYNRGHLYMRLGNNELAKYDLKKALELKPNYKIIDDLISKLD